ncbi:hypothetical protein B9479_003104 [Cryptococcus floricola]|uniref:Uncharacterized protein n=1 Tax=Cryptococcus floricola TaxID=2591691 RepID=A0A5D3AZN2_9TREE|nr:hypothetical protein B9479_003104 [Cryptococcus floricola]
MGSTPTHIYLKWQAVAVDPVWALFCTARRLGLGHQQQVFMSIIMMPGDHDPENHIVETAELTRNSIPWDDIPLGWFRGVADLSAQSHYGWLFRLSFDPFSKDTHYGDAQIAILNEKRSIVKAKEGEESQRDRPKEF